MSLNIKLARDFDEFLRLKQPWNELAACCEADHAFMRHEWFECWIRYLGEPRALAIQTLWADGLLVAAAPLQIKRQKIHGIPLRVLSFLSSSVSPRCNFLVHPTIESRPLFDAVFKISGWDIAHLENLETGQSITDHFTSYLDSSYWKNYQTEPGRRSPFQIISGNWDSYFAGLSKNHRKNIRTAFKRLENSGSYSFEEYDTFDRLESVFQNIVDVSGSSWKKVMGSDMHSSEKISTFYREFSRAGSQAGLWKVYMLQIDGKFVAYDYLLRHNKRLTGIRSDYDLAFKDYMPGHLMKVATIKDLCSRNEPWEYDMGGTDAGYKLSYADTIREHVNITASSPGLYGNLVLIGKRNVWPLLKKMKKPAQVESGTTPANAGKIMNEPLENRGS